MELDTGDLYTPRCCLCFIDDSEGDLLGQISCGHVYCAPCLTTIQTGTREFLCPVDSLKSYTAWADPDLSQVIRSFRANLCDLETYLGVLSGKINYKGVKCRWEHRKTGICPKPCPYMHAFNPLAAVECPLGMNCWRKEVCLMRHNEQKAAKIELKAPSIAHLLLSDDAARLKSVLKAPNCKITVDYPAEDEIEQVNWCFLTPNQTIQSFEPNEMAQLEANFSANFDISRLKDGSNVHFRHMINIATNGDFRPVARIPFLASFRQVARVEIVCTQEQHETLGRYLEEITGFSPISRTILSIDMLEIAREFGVSVNNEQIIGTKEAIFAVSDHIKAYKLAIFPQYASLPLPPDTYIPALRSDPRLQMLLFQGQLAYGSPEDIGLLRTILPDFEYSVPYPAGVDEYNVAILCSELGLNMENKRIIGRKELVLRSVERLTTEKVMIPADANEEDLVMALSMHTTVEIAGQMLQGPKDQVAEVLKYLKSTEIEQEFPTNLPYQTIQTAITRYQVRLNGNQLIGTRSNVTAALDFLKQAAPAAIPPKEGFFQYHVLPDWYANLDMEVYADMLLPGSEEYLETEGIFMKTMKNQAQIVQILKIFNKKMYTNFAYKHESKSQVEGKCLKIKQLFHGTRATDPSVIYMSEDGLDSRLGGGMWGNGTYYAQNASYSHQFAYHTAAGSLQMFLCDVLVGDDITMGPQAIVKPPAKKDNPNAFHHSVKGNTGGSNIWITYEVSMSYPKYLIDYRAGK